MASTNLRNHDCTENAQTKEMKNEVTEIACILRKEIS
jgi:hypothetical protein